MKFDANGALLQTMLRSQTSHEFEARQGREHTLISLIAHTFSGAPEATR